ncbi:MAG: hypothetical protein NTU91_16685 [Chloroflexi bacterium]|nr:hypothetical protein [Chloroflexota bacterium]
MRAKRTHAARQAAWRLQVRWTGKTMLLAIVFLVVSGVYLAVNARLARAGREVLTLEDRRSELLRVTSELGSELATRTAPETMLARAGVLGFHPAGPDDVVFLTIDDYIPPAEFVAPRPSAADDDGQAMLSPAYTETLGDWLMRWIGSSESAS